MNTDTNTMTYTNTNTNFGNQETQGQPTKFQNYQHHLCVLTAFICLMSNYNSGCVMPSISNSQSEKRESFNFLKINHVSFVIFLFHWIRRPEKSTCLYADASFVLCNIIFIFLFHWIRHPEKFTRQVCRCRYCANMRNMCNIICNIICYLSLSLDLSPKLREKSTSKICRYCAKIV